MKFYIWQNEKGGSDEPSCIVAMANSVAEARKIIQKSKWLEEFDKELIKKRPKVLNRSFAGYVESNTFFEY